MMLLCTNLGKLWVTLFHQIYKYTFPKRKYSIYNSKNPPKYHPVDMFCHKKYMVRFMVRTILNSPNPELNLRFGSGILVNCELNLWFGSGWFRFEPKFRTELFHHYRRVIWVFGIFLFPFFWVLYILTNGFLFYLGCIYVL